MRSLRTPFAREYVQAEYGEMPDDELEHLATGKLCLAGQIAALARREQPAAEILRKVMEEAESILHGSSKMGKIASVFSGQGDPFSGMGSDIAAQYPAAARAFTLCDSLRPGTLRQCFSDTPEELAPTVDTQPCLYAMESSMPRRARRPCARRAPPSANW